MAGSINRRGVLLGIGGTAVLGTAALVGRAGDRGRDPAAPTRGRGAWTTFGSVAVLGSTLWRATSDGGHDHGDAAMAEDGHDHGTHDHGDHAGIHAVSPTAHGSWQDTVIVDVEVHNGTGEPILASPGQFRLRVDGGPSVSFYDTEHGPVAVAPGSALGSRISYLVPAGVTTLAVEYDDPEETAPLTFTLHPTSPQGVA